MSTTHPVDAVEAYINEVRDRLSDVPDEDRIDLLDDVAAHVREIADEFGADELHTRLGSPAEFSDELRASAGYDVGDGELPAGTKIPVARRARDWFARHVATQANRALWHRLEPGWWVARGVLFGYFVLSLTGAQAELVPRLGNSQVFGLALLVASAVASFQLGERGAGSRGPWVRRLRVAGEVALVLFALSYVADSSHSRVVYINDGYATPSDPCLRDSAGRPIGNLYAFDPAGQLIPQFFLTDQAGRPIDNLCPDQVPADDLGPAETQYARDTNGAPVYGVFPRHQTEPTRDPRSGELGKKPVAPPAVVFPQLAPTADTTPTTQTPAP